MKTEPIALHMMILLQHLEEQKKISKGICPKCETRLIYQNGCKQCNNCGWSACDN